MTPVCLCNIDVDMQLATSEPWTSNWAMEIFDIHGTSFWVLPYLSVNPIHPALDMASDVLEGLAEDVDLLPLGGLDWDWSNPSFVCSTRAFPPVHVALPAAESV